MFANDVLAVCRRMKRIILEHPVVAAMAIFLLSFFVRLALLVYLGFKNLGAAEIDNIALALLKNHQFADPYAVATGPTAHTTPFYPLLVAGVYRLFGTGYAGHIARSVLVIAAYSLLYSLYVWLAPGFGFSKKAGLVAGFCSALLPVKRSAEVFLGWEEPYAAMGLAGLLLLTMRHWAAPNRRSTLAVWIGVGWGIALYISFSLAAVLVGVILLDIVMRRSWNVIRDNMLIVLTATVLMSPWIVRNCIELHGWVLMRDSFGLNVWISNNAHAHASSELINADPIGRTTYPYGSVVEATKIREIGELAYNRYKLQVAREWIQQNPRKFAILCLQRVLYFWMGPFEHPYELTVTTLYTLLGIIGVWFMRRHVGVVQVQLWAAALVCFPLTYYLVEYINRYRAPIDWMVWLSAGQAMVIMTEKVADAKSRRQKLIPISVKPAA